MTQLIKWHGAGDHKFEQGLDNMVLYPWDSVAKDYGDGIPWNGAISIDESPTGGEPNARYADNRKYLTLYSEEELGLGLNAFMYPPEFEECDGTATPIEGLAVQQQERKMFGLCYRTKIGDELTSDLGYKYHFVYGCKASPAQKSYQSTGESPDAMQFSWSITTTKVDVPNFKPSSHLIIDSSKITAPKLAALLEIIYGEEATTQPVAPAVPARLPMPSELISLLGAA